MLEYHPPIHEGMKDRRVSFKDIEVNPQEEEEPKTLEASKPVTAPVATSPAISPIPTSPTEPRPRSESLTMGQRSNNPVRLTPKLFLDYEHKKEKAQQAMKARVESSEPRYPTMTWSGNYFSESMPAGPHREPASFEMRDGLKAKAPWSPSATPQGLSSINQVRENRGLYVRIEHLCENRGLYVRIEHLCENRGLYVRIEHLCENRGLYVRIEHLCENRGLYVRIEHLCENRAFM